MDVLPHMNVFGWNALNQPVFARNPFVLKSALSVSLAPNIYAYLDVIGTTRAHW